MFIPKFVVVVSMSLPDPSSFVNAKKDVFNHHYSTNVQTMNENTIDYNYIKTEDYIKNNIEKYQDILW